MEISLFKPSPFENNGQYAGAAFSFKLLKTPDGPKFIMSGVKQKSYNAEKKLGSFFNNKDNPDQSVSVKFNEIELGNLIYSIKNYKDFSAFHTFGEDKTTITFKPYNKKPKQGETEGAKAFSLTVKKNGSLTVGLGVELGEAEMLRVFIETALAEIFYASIRQPKEQHSSQE